MFSYQELSLESGREAFIEQVAQFIDDHGGLVCIRPDDQKFIADNTYPVVVDGVRATISPVILIDVKEESVFEDDEPWQAVFDHLDAPYTLSDFESGRVLNSDGEPYESVEDWLKGEHDCEDDLDIEIIVGEALVSLSSKLSESDFGHSPSVMAVAEREADKILRTQGYDILLNLEAQGKVKWEPPI